ncbi:MAG TPA: C45 family autoproteolytic acyltransferase/hydrolase [Paludibacteraceae bacterium]|nr:C45 family autoproteolytic acyltransferase/hydrolase [Paludibacteraceae bacterium]HOU68881.1 C45 family autoproteolytic acyltransferase/hydrolase [Paludibacteraceae bacterium]HPH63136.1 C45 family autoproteolytic acyltransferase/hydrolase [Paludibacteraceae bacterium]
MKKFFKILAFILGILLLITIGVVIYYNIVVEIEEPQPKMPAIANDTVVKRQGYYSIGNNWIRESESGLFEVYVEGSDIERGVALGKMEKGLMYFQEKVFVDQINELIPSQTYVSFLKYFILYFNRNLSNYVPSEYKTEIYGEALECTHEFDYIGTPYERQLNYHAAHDIGHAMQDYMLVGCTAFAAWDDKSEDSTLIIGRNFDFYMGEEFARNKIVTFCRPEHGYKFAMVGWAGMIGVLSGMNEAGLTVTLNAAKSDMPTSSALPISLLARQILQYASTIEEAYAIADSSKTFVSESLLIGSAKDKRAAIIEKSTEKTALYKPNAQSLVCANHYQSEAFAKDERNLENIQTSDSPYRLKRAEQLMEKNYPINYKKAVAILRDTRGLNDANIGLGNEKALNQLIGHHSVVFQPEKGIMWVSTSPWQLGKFVAYDLNKIFQSANPSAEIYTRDLEVAADTLINTPEFANFLGYRNTKKVILKNIKDKVFIPTKSIQNFTKMNPNLFQTYEIAGDAFLSNGKADSAICYWQKALKLEIPKVAERKKIEEKVEKNKKE